MPELENDEEIKIDNNDLRIDVFKAGGAGGQSVQKLYCCKNNSYPLENFCFCSK